MIRISGSAFLSAAVSLLSAAGQTYSTPQPSSALVSTNRECRPPSLNSTDRVDALLLEWRYAPTTYWHDYPLPARNFTIVGAAASQITVVRKVSGGTDGKPVQRAAPAYPPEALQQGLHGSVKLTAHTTTVGSVMSVSIVCGHPLLAKAAVEAVQQWVYKPILVNDIPVEFIVEIDLDISPATTK